MCLFEGGVKVRLLNTHKRQKKNLQSYSIHCLILIILYHSKIVQNKLRVVKVQFSRNVLTKNSALN